MRRFLTFSCQGDLCAATLDLPANQKPTVGLFIVSGGNEIRSGAHGGMARLAEEAARAGYPVFRFDRRGIGDSGGSNGGYQASAPDIVAALRTFRKELPSVRRIIALGNCDAATALVLLGAGHGVSAYVLANPWVIEGEDSPELLRRRNWESVRTPAKWRSLLLGRINPFRFLFSLFRGLRRGEAATDLADRVGLQLTQLGGPATILLARRDRTAMAFQLALDKPAFEQVRLSEAVRIERIESASHSFASAEEAAWLEAQVLHDLRQCDQAASTTASKSDS